MTRFSSTLTGALIVAALATPMVAHAQQWDLSLAALRSTNSSLGAPLIAIAPTGAITGRGWRLTSEVNTIDRLGTAKVAGVFSAAALGPHLGPFRTEAYGDLATGAGQPQEDARVAARLHLAAADHGLWAGVGVGRAGERTGNLRSAGAWLRGKLGSTSIRFDQVVGAGEAAGLTTYDTVGLTVIPHYRPGTPSVRLQSVSASYSTAGGRLQLILGASQMRGAATGDRRSASAVATWWVDRAFALVGGYGPPVGNGFIPVAGAVKLGVLWRPAKGMPRTLSLVEPTAIATTGVERVGPGEWRLRLPADRAHSVEIEGSFNGWEPMPLHETGDGWWEVTLPLPPGRHELTWRRDQGSWRTLPGLPTVSDDLLGDVTVIVIDPE